jgi:hypothetical protein
MTGKQQTMAFPIAGFLSIRLHVKELTIKDYLRSPASQILSTALTSALLDCVIRSIMLIMFLSMQGEVALMI